MKRLLLLILLAPSLAFGMLRGIGASTDYAADIDSFLAAEDFFSARNILGVQTAHAYLTDISNMGAATGDIMQFNGTDWVVLNPGTSGWFLKSNGPGAALSFAAVPGGGDALTTNPLSQFAATTSAQYAGVISDETGTGAVVLGTSPTITTPSLSGIVTLNGAQITTSSAMAALAIDVTKYLNTKSISVDSTLTFSATPAANTWFGLFLTNTDTAGHTITIPSSYSMASNSTKTSFYLPAGHVAYIQWRYNGTVYRMFGEPGVQDNYAATTDPTVNDDVSLGYAVGSRWVNVTGDKSFELVDATDGAAIWQRRYNTVFGASTVGLVPAAGASPSSTKYLSEDGTFSTPAGGGYSQVDFTTNATTHTGTLTATTVTAWSKTIPANTFTANKRMTVRMRLTRSGPAGTYTISHALGGQTVITSISVSTASRYYEFEILAKGNADQRAFQTDGSNFDSWGSTTPLTTTVDMTASQDLTTTITLADVGQVVTLAEMSIEVK